MPPATLNRRISFILTFNFGSNRLATGLGSKLYISSRIPTSFSAVRDLKNFKFDAAKRQFYCVPLQPRIRIFLPRELH